jgi:hypothetical protein
MFNRPVHIITNFIYILGVANTKTFTAWEGYRKDIKDCNMSD